MTHTLMHKDLLVADLDFDQATGFIGKIGTIHHGDHLPVGVQGNGKICGSRVGRSHHRFSKPSHPTAGNFYPYPAAPGGFHRR